MGKHEVFKKLGFGVMKKGYNKYGWMMHGKATPFHVGRVLWEIRRII